MFRRLIMAIFRLYTEYLLSSYTEHTWAVYMGWGVKWARDLVSVRKVGWCGLYDGSCCYQAMSKLIIVESMVRIILCLYVDRKSVV